MVMSGRSCLATAFLANKNFNEAKMRAEDQLPEWRDPDFAAKAEEESEKGQRSEPMLHVMRAINLHPVLSTAHELLASSKTEKRQKYRNLLSILLELDARDSQSQTPELQQSQDNQDYEEPSLDIRGKAIHGKRGGFPPCSVLGLPPILGLPLSGCLTVANSVINHPDIRSASDSTSKSRHQWPSMYLLGGAVGR